jgi:molybdopterin-guanine dinucleotide biosynthesis protein A
MAGGKNSRMGKNKAFLQVGGETILENIVKQLKKVTSDLIIVSSRPRDFRHSGIKTVSDIYPGCGPLGGIHAGLTNSDNAVNLVVACDMPFLQPEVLEYLIQRGEGYDVVIPRLGKYVEPLTACYNKSCLQVIENRLKARRLKITSFFSEVNVLYVERDKLCEMADIDHLFLNVNTPEDLHRAREIKKKIGVAP